jgi:hypothetical protein
MWSIVSLKTYLRECVCMCVFFRDQDCMLWVIFAMTKQLHYNGEFLMNHNLCYDRHQDWRTTIKNEDQKLRMKSKS